MVVVRTKSRRTVQNSIVIDCCHAFCTLYAAFVCSDDASEVGQALMGAKALCIPFDQPAEVDSGTPCVHPECSNKANCFTLFGRSY